MANLLDKASIILTPTAYSESSLKNVIPSSEPFGDMELVKDGTSTRVNESGLVETVATDIPRIDYSKGDGAILVELQGTNQARYSEDFSNVLWQKVGVTLTSSTGINPRGESATIYAIQGQAAQGGLEGAMASSATGQGVGVSCWVRKKNGVGTTNVEIGFGDSSTVTTNTVSVGSDWQRITYTSINGTAANRFYIDAEGILADDTIEIWGAQIEKSTSGQDGKVTSYIPTTSGSVTRERDNYSGGGGSTLIGQTEGVFFFEGASLHDAETGRGMSLSDSSPTNRVILYFDFASQKLRGTIRDGLGANIVLTGTVSDQTAFNKVAIKYKSGDIALWINGTEVETSTATFSFTSDLNELAFDQGNPANHMEGFIKQVIVYKEALTDAEITALTS
jgi:hypothetical protein